MLEDWKTLKQYYLLPILSCFTLMSSAAAYFIRKRRKTSLLGYANTGSDGSIPFAPNRLPVIGHLLSLGPVPSKQVSQWHREIGPLYQLQMGTQQWIMVADPVIAYELFVKQSRKSSSRPYHTFAVKIYGRNNRGIVFTDQSAKWKSERKAATAILSPGSVDRFSDILEFEADIFIERIYETSQRDGSVNPYQDLQLCSLNIITTTCLAARIEDINDPVFKKIARFVHGAMIYGGIAGDLGSFIPSLAWVDVVTRKEKEMQDFVSIYRDEVYEQLIDNALNGDAECLIKNVYQMMEEMNLDEDDILVFMSDFVGAGADTIAVSLYWTFAILSQKPNVQARIIKELDKWKKRHGNVYEMPEYNKHRDSFPYMAAVQKEIMRFRPTTNFGIPHAVTEEMLIGDYVIPKGAVLISSMAAMHMNPEFYDEPHIFNPDRFLNNTQKMARAAHCKVDERDHFGFGWGRRICPGIHLAEVELFNIYVRLFSRFIIEPQLDQQGNPIYTDLNDFEDYGIIAKPLPFKVRLVAREEGI